ncbi:MAG: twin-arginine translocase subunit TatC, partial [marine benthic group bacterium]|nr:twin-arginine translocase subunit TatC [Gemmatimonadota bacterium]
HAVVGLAITSALLTPADVGTMAMLFTPMILLYEASIWLVQLVVGNRGSGGRIRSEEESVPPGGEGGDGEPAGP